ncbi:MAG: carboxypeptidase-like regulatory domain-containing protein [Bacteroidales bacterium]|nr:carboxypeptidase-like regulatory domain-containing protein [Bacteroidales bacterium]
MGLPKEGSGWDLIGSTTNSSLYYWDSSRQCLRCSSQSLSTAEESRVYLVSPALTGEVTLEVAKYNYSNYTFQVWSAIEDAEGALALGEEMVTLGTDELSSTSESSSWFGPVTFDFEEPTRMAIYLAGTSMRNFTYTPTEPTEELIIYNASCVSKNLYSDAEGLYTIQFTDINLQNTGDYSYDEGELRLRLYDLYAEVFLSPEVEMPAMENGTEAFNAADFTFSADAYADTDVEITNGVERVLTLVETTTGAQWSGNVHAFLYPYERHYSFSPEAIVFGVTDANGSTRQLTLSNIGTLDVVVTSIEYPEEISAEVEFPFTLTNAGDTTGVSSMGIDFCFKTDEIGSKAGVIKFAIEGEEEPIEIAWTGVIRDPSYFFQDFEEYEAGDRPEQGYVYNNSLWSVATPSGYTSMALCNTSVSESSRVVLPRIKAEEGDIMMLTAGYTSAARYGVSVQISSDRENWTTLMGRTTSVEAYQPSFIDQNDGVLTKDGEDYSFSLPAGEWYIAIEGQACYVDNIYLPIVTPAADDLVILSSVQDANGMVNNQYAGSITIANLGANSYEPDAYEVVMHVGDQEVVPSETEAFEANTTVTYQFVFTPHFTGVVPVYFSWSNGDITLATEAVEVEFVEETASGTIIVGDENGSLTNAALSMYGTRAPFSTTAPLVENALFFPASLLAEYGLKEGMKITAMSYLGYDKGVYGMTDSGYSGYVAYIGDYTVKVKQGTFGSVSDSGFSFTDEDAAFTDDDIVYSNSAHTFQPAGTTTEAAEIYYAEFDVPVDYEGDDLAISQYNMVSGYETNISTSGSSMVCLVENTAYSGYGKVSWETYGTAYAGGTVRSLPVIKLYYVNPSPKVSGYVTTEDGPVEGAQLTLACGDVYYTGTTDIDGYYEIAVVQSTLEYVLTVEVEGFESMSQEVTFTDDEDQTVDFQFITSSIISIAEDSFSESPVYNLQGIRVTGTLRPGIYIINGKKVQIK